MRRPARATGHGDGVSSACTRRHPRSWPCLPPSTPPGVQPLRFMPGAASSPATQSPLYRRLAAELRGDVLFDTASRGRYATDASIYQVMPIGVVVPRDEADAAAGAGHRPRLQGALLRARRRHQPVRADRWRGAGHRQQQVSSNQVIDFDPVARTVTVQPGIVLDHLNALARRTGCGSRWMSPRRRSARSAAWPATTRAGRARSSTATWCTTCWASRPSWPAARTCASTPAGAADGAPHRAIADGVRRIAERRARGHRRDVPARAAARGRLQPRPVPPPERAALHRRRQRQPRPPAGRLGGHAGLFPAPDPASWRRCPRTRRWAW